jgi:hypothetical protein
MENLSLIEVSTRLITKYPDRIPVIIEKTKDIILQNYKYILPKNISMCTFLSTIRTKMNITEKQAIFTFVKNGNNYVLVPMNETMGSIYNIHKSKDNFLYIKFGIENTFG